MIYITKLSNLQHKIKKKNSYILVELLIAFSIATAALSGFFAIYSCAIKKQSMTLQEAKIWLIGDNLLSDILKKEGLKELLASLEEKQTLLLFEEKNQEVIISKKMKMQIDYALVATTIKSRERKEGGIIKLIKLKLTIRGGKAKQTLTYPLTITFGCV